MEEIIAIDPVSMTATVQAGVYGPKLSGLFKIGDIRWGIILRVLSSRLWVAGLQRKGPDSNRIDMGQLIIGWFLRELSVQTVSGVR